MAPVITENIFQENTHYTSPEVSIPLGEYLFLRIAQANPNLKSIFGIPGDFNLALLEHLYAPSIAEEKGIEFIGICNELNAAYAADGYSKTIKGLSTLITTYGVGELSALNGIAGSFAEYAPVLHIVGTSSTRQSNQARGCSLASEVINIHHLVQNKNVLASPDHDVYKKVIKDFSVALETLGLNGKENIEKIDRVLRAILREHRPGYLFVPSDAPDTLVPRLGLAQSLEVAELTNEKLLSDISASILNKLYCSERPSILGDALLARFGAQDNFLRLIEAIPSNFVKLFSSNIGRVMNESLPNFVGVYQGRLTANLKIAESLENNTDLLLSLGHLNNEINTGGYSTRFEHISDYVEVHPDYILMDGDYTYIKDPLTGVRAFSLDDLIGKLASDFDAKKLANVNWKKSNIDYRYEPCELGLEDPFDKSLLTQNRLADFFNLYLQQDDVLVVETCSFLFAVGDLKFPKGVDFYSQLFYGSIGYALPATLGICRGLRDLGSKRRVLLVQGDGSAQMTVQELSSYLRYDIEAPKIFLLNNEGYTVERFIMGPTRSYNDIQSTWRWTDFFKIFGDPNEEKHKSVTIENLSQLYKTVNRCRSEMIEMYELYLPKMNMPERFSKMMQK